MSATVILVFDLFTTVLHGLFESIYRSGANPEKVLHIRGGATQVYLHDH